MKVSEPIEKLRVRPEDSGVAGWMKPEPIGREHDLEPGSIILVNLDFLRQVTPDPED